MPASNTAVGHIILENAIKTAKKAAKKEKELTWYTAHYNSETAAALCQGFEKKYPGVKYGARGTGKLPVGSYYGYGTGIVGLRLFPNPNFDEEAQAAWDPVRYYTDPAYYNSDKLVKPYRVGMSCGFCHVGPNPSNPPADPENPKWENLNSNPGAQYFWIDRIFDWCQEQRIGWQFDPDLVLVQFYINDAYESRPNLGWEQGRSWGSPFAEILAGKPGHVDYDTIPSVIYTWPEVASPQR